MTQREEFEEWYEREGQSKPFTTVSIKDKMHEAWQAAKTQAVPETNKAILQSLRDMVEIVGANFCSNQDVKRKYKIARELLEQNK